MCVRDLQVAAGLIACHHERRVDRRGSVVGAEREGRVVARWDGDASKGGWFAKWFRVPPSNHRAPMRTSVGGADADGSGDWFGPRRYGPNGPFKS